MRTFALVPAAGKSVRMGRPKLLLPLGGRTVIECAIAALKKAGIADVLVVVSPQATELKKTAVQAGARVLQLGAETPDMQSTILHGLAWIEQQHDPRSGDNWLLVPADHPMLDPKIILELLRARTLHPEKSIFVPSYQSRRGHPTLIGWRHTAEIRAWPAGRGLNQYLRTQAEVTGEVAVHSADILVDLDTPADYDDLVKRYFKEM